MLREVPAGSLRQIGVGQETTISMEALSPQILAGVSFFVHPTPVGRLCRSGSIDIDGRSIIPVTLVQEGLENEAALSRSLKDFEREDDVFAGAKHVFSHYVVVTPRAGLGSIEGRSEGIACADEALPSGPYFLVGDRIHQAWRLYEDDLDAFAIPTIPVDPSHPTSYRPLDVGCGSGLWKSIAVPSRLYSKGSAKPLAGLRVALKDAYGVAGIKTTMMSRSWCEMYDHATETSEYVDKLISLGAVIVGKTKMTSFAAADEPTDQWVDFHCPTNPRGDRYQSPSGSSAGSGAALAGYAWLDESIGEDTAGSTRHPATSNGLFALRTTLGSSSMNGVMPTCAAFDAVGIFGRSLSAMERIASYSLSGQHGTFRPTEILYPTDFFPHPCRAQQEMVEEFVQTLERYLGVRRTAVSLAKFWTQQPPQEAQDIGLDEYLTDSAFQVQCHDYHNHYLPYRQAYRARFSRLPFVSRAVTWRWAVGAAVDEVQAEAHWKKLEVFRQWFSRSIFDVTDASTGTIMIMPYGDADPKYRDDPNDPPTSSPTLGYKYVSPVLQIPQIVVPIGQLPYDSRVTGRTEYRPIIGSFVAARGCDTAIIRLAREALEHAEWPTSIKTGRNMFDLADNPRHTAPSPPSCQADQSVSNGVAKT